MSKLDKLEEIAKKAKPVFAFGKAVLPIFKRENLDEHVNTLIRNNPNIRSAIEKNPRNYDILKRTAYDLYTKARPYITGAKLVDSWDRVTSSLSLLAEAFPGAGQLVSAGEEVVELIPKVFYSLYYALKTKDYKALPYFALAEAASFIPIVGDLIDLSNIYVNRARKTFQRKVANSFLEEIVA